MLITSLLSASRGEYLTGLNILLNSPGDTKTEGEGRISFCLRNPVILCLALHFPYASETIIIFMASFLMQSEQY